MLYFYLVISFEKMMENISVLSRPLFNSDNVDVTSYDIENGSHNKPDFSPVNSGLTAEGGKNFFHYLKNFNLSKEPDLLILPPNSHYFYDENDLRNVKTLINLKKLNLIKDLDTFLQNIFHILPLNVNFIGCFSNSKTISKNGLLSKLSARFYNLLDYRTDNNLDNQDVSRLLEKWGFKIVDMTEMNGLTYFYSQNSRQAVEIRA
jgi:hypothetical protein